MPSFLRHLVISLVLPITLVSFTSGRLSLTPWEIRALYVAVVVAAFNFWNGLEAYLLRRAARQHNAILPPVLEGKWLLSIDLLRSLSKRWGKDWPGEALEPYMQKYGLTLCLHILGTRRYFTRDPEIIKNMLTGPQFPIFGKGKVFQKWFEDFLGQGIFNSDPDDVWKWHRSLTRPHFSREKISDLETVDRHALKMINLFRRQSAEGLPSDCQEVFGRFTMDAATEFLLGGSVESLEELESELDSPHSLDDQTSRSFLKAFSKLQANSVFRSRYDQLWQIIEIFGSANKEPMKVVTPLIDGIIERAIVKRDQDSKDVQVDEHTTLVDYLVTQTRDVKMIRDEVLNILLAGRDTTASLLTSITYMFARHPQVYQKARQEVLSNIGLQTPTYDGLKKLRYLRAVINETLRAWPPVPFNVRSALKPTVLSNGMYVPQGTTVSYSIFNLQRDRARWGDDAQVWDPERWLDSNRLRCMLDQPFIFQPFSAGPRICLGQQFAYNEVTLAMTRFLQRFETIEVARDAQPHDSYYQDTDHILCLPLITLIWKNGVYIRFKEGQED